MFGNSRQLVLILELLMNELNTRLGSMDQAEAQSTERDLCSSGQRTGSCETTAVQNLPVAGSIWLL